MDPNAALQTIIQALVKDNNGEALTALSGLMFWLNEGRCMPDLTPIETALDMIYYH